MPRLFAVQLKDGPAERYEQWVNTPVYTRDYEDCVGWLGCELPEDGHSCEFAELAGDGAVTCASSVKVNRLRDENDKLRELVKAFWWCTEDSDLPYKCDRCPLSQSSKVECECEVIMRKLGIEATDA